MLQCQRSCAFALKSAPRSCTSASKSALSSCMFAFNSTQSSCTFALNITSRCCQGPLSAWHMIKQGVAAYLKHVPTLLKADMTVSPVCTEVSSIDDIIFERQDADTTGRLHSSKLHQIRPFKQQGWRTRDSVISAHAQCNEVMPAFSKKRPKFQINVFSSQ